MSGVLPVLQLTSGMEGDEAVAVRPLLHGFFQDHLLRKNDHVDVLKLTESLQDLSHGFGLGLFHHGTYAHDDLSSQLEENGRANVLAEQGEGITG